MTIRRTILAAVTDTAAELGIPQDKSGRPNPALEVSKSDRPDLADYQCNAAMVLAKDLRKSPRAIASELQTGLTTHLNGIAKVDIAGPGFINFRLDDDYLLGQVDKNTTCATGTGESVSLPPRKVLIDFGGPNIAKELHIGHLRPHLIGDSLQRIAKACGDHVTSDIHMGDWGTPMGMIIAQLQHEKPELPYFSDVFSTFPKESPVSIEDLGGLYRRAKQNWDNNHAFQDKAREATEKLQSGSRPGYRALWQHFRDVSLSDVRKMYDKLGIHFDLWLGESDVNDVLPPMICDLTQRGIA